METHRAKTLTDSPALTQDGRAGGEHEEGEAEQVTHGGTRTFRGEPREINHRNRADTHQRTETEPHQHCTAVGHEQSKHRRNEERLEEEAEQALPSPLDASQPVG